MAHYERGEIHENPSASVVMVDHFLAREKLQWRVTSPPPRLLLALAELDIVIQEAYFRSPGTF